MVKKTNGAGANSPRTLGPIPDLERHLPADWWRNLFNSVYLKTDGDVIENDANTRHEVDRLIQAAGLELADRVLDLCCGQGRHCLELARRGYRHVYGLDRSRYLIRLARSRAQQEGLEVGFHEGDARKFRLNATPLHCVAVLGNSFGYFESEEEDRAVLGAIKRALGAGGTLVLDLVEGDWMRSHFEPRSWEWIDAEHLVCRERSLAADRQRLISREVVVHAERGIIVDQFYAERLYSSQQVEALLADCGFEAVRCFGPIQGESTRGQDLGMMSHRLLWTARSPRLDGPGGKPAGTRKKEITVLLGDPRLPDMVKREGQFNAEDFETVERLKRALGELDAFTFRYLDNHAAMMRELRANPPEFVLNLCDEGFDNDAFLELHVPAYLEMLGVPCTGGGPSCLGLCYNKSLVNAIAAQLEIPVPLETYFDADDQSATLPSTLPALVKPNYGDSSIGITQHAIVHTPEELIGYINMLKETLPGRPLLVQEYLTGAEFSIGIIGNPGLSLRVLPALEVDFSQLPPDLPPILGYESKWIPGSPYWTRVRYHEASLGGEALRRLQDDSITLFQRLGCRDYARFDFRADAEGTIKLLEVNPNPGWCWDGKLNFMAGYAGLRYADLLRMILEAALERVAATGKRLETAATPASSLLN